MKILIIPDIHNRWLDAEAIIDKEKSDKVVFLGDHAGHAPHDLVSQNQRQLGIRQVAIHDVKVGAAHPARVHLYLQLPRRGLRLREFPLVQKPARRLEHHCAHGCVPVRSMTEPTPRSKRVADSLPIGGVGA